ncbi:MAG TPA: DUF2585 family protein [Vitreimonas sp.]|nr:DUF2585 family protein [Vitreimonas sp.]
MNRVVYCTCGYIKLWQSNSWSSENSQHLLDWYTLSHVIHGFIFYWLLQRFVPKWSIGTKMLMALMIEIVWEIWENTEFVISRYREVTASLHYDGDSIVNSVSDILACLVGFWLARTLPWWQAMLVVIIMEIGAALIIRDNLTLNVLMLIYPWQLIKNWQLELAPPLP